jgi:primosomal protein N'
MVPMYIVQVIPISRGVAPGELSYFSGSEYPQGAVILVPLRGREVMGIVVGCETVRATKASVRQSGYALRKIKRQAASAVVTGEFVRAAQKTAQYYAATPGAVLFPYLPKALQLQGGTPYGVHTGPRPRLRGFIIPRLYQGLADNRLEFYRTVVREAFAAKGSVLLLAPTIADVERVHRAMLPGIERYVYVLHTSLRRTLQTERVTALLESEHPVLIVATPSFLSLPRHDLTTIVVEREGSSLYRSRTRPFVDVRVLAHNLAAELGGQLFLADLPLRIDSIERRELGEYEEVVTGHHRMHFPTPATLVSLKGEGRPPKKPFRAISADLLRRIDETTARGGRVFLYVARRGLSPVTLCNDCGLAVTCKECGASVVLHKGKEENYFLCHSCGAMRHARERCSACSSWRLEAFGIGTELVERELHQVRPDLPVSVLSSDTAKTHAVARKIATTFYETAGGLLVGTELALPYLAEQVPLVGVVSLDSLLSLASWNIYERIASTLTRLREISSEELMLQTRHPDTDILATVLAGNFSRFYKSELRARKALGYPPFTVIIKVSVVGTQSEVTARMEEAHTTLAPYELITFSRPIKAPGGKLSLHGFIRVAREKWPDPALVVRLQRLPPLFTITVDPDSIL